MAELVWQNTFDDVAGNVTAANSGAFGDPITSADSGSVLYTQEEKAHGAGAVRLGSLDNADSGSMEIDFTVGTDTAWGSRFYVYVPPGGYIMVEVGNGNNAKILVEIDDDLGTFALLGEDVSDESANLLGRWLRVYYTQRLLGQTVDEAVEVRWSQPDNEPTPDLFKGGTTPVRFNQGVWHRFTGGGYSTPASYVDSVAAWDDIADSGGSLPTYYSPGTAVLVDNTLEGPDGTAVTQTNSGDYGTPISTISGSPVYSAEWTAKGEGSVEFPDVTAFTEISWRADYRRSQYAIRAYFYIGPNSSVVISLSTGQQLRLSTNPSISSTWMDETVEVDPSDITDRTLRVEILRVDFTATLRLYWTSPYGHVDAYDLEVVVDSTNTFSVIAYSFYRSSNSQSAAYVDEVVVREAAAEWIGPVELDGGLAEAGVVFGGVADGTADVAGTLVAEVEYDGEAAGTKRVTADVEATVVFDGEVEHDAREIGLAAHTVEYSGEAEGTAARVRDVETDVEYSGEVEWLTERSSEGEADIVVGGVAAGESRITLPDVTRVGLRYRLVVYEPNGEARGQIPLPLNFTVGVPLNDLPSLSLEYLRDAPGYERLNGYCEVAVELATLASPAFFEPDGMRFINIRAGSDMADRTRTVKYSMPHYAWQLRKARVIENLTEGQRSFTNATVGQILHTFLSEAQGRGWNPGMSWDFTPQRDSAGQVWDDVYTITFDAGQDLLTILEAFAQQAALDFSFRRRILRVFNADTALNRNRTNQAVLQLGRDITEAPNDWTSEELAARVHVRGDENTSITMTVPDAQQPWGTWEMYVNQSGVTDYSTLNRLGSWTLEKARQPLVQMTRGILFPTTQYMPFRDYQPGDYISAPGDPEGPFTPPPLGELRVRQITLVSVEGQGVEGALVLNERFIENGLRRDRLLNAITGGAGSNPGGGGGGTPPREDTRTPRAPQGLVVASDTFINEIGEPRGQITASWEAVDEATNGTAMDIVAYEVFVRWAAAGQTFGLRTTVDSPDTTAYMGPYDPDEVYEVRVRAVGRNQRRSVFSSTVPVRVEKDAIPPDIPSDPILESRLGVVRVTWDGLSNFGTPMPLDFDHVTVWMSLTASEEDGWEVVDTLYRQGVSVIPNLEYDTDYYFRFTATDRSGNESDPSQLASISVQQLVPGDITPGSIGYELLEEGAVRDDILADDAVRNRHVAAGEITGEKIRAYSIFADRIAIGNTRNLITDPKHVDEDLSQLRLDNAEGVWTYNYDAANAQDAPYVWRGDNDNGTYRFYWVQSVEAEDLTDPHGYIPIAAQEGRMVATARITVGGRTSGTVSVGMYGQFLDRQGNPIPGSLAVISPVSIDSNVTDFEITSNNGARPDEGAAYALLFAEVILTGTNDNTWVRVSRPFTAMSNGQVLIENGAVTANKVAANAITADKIIAGAIQAVHIQSDAITTDKLAANAITAKHTITGALIQTTASSNRGLEISSTGLRGYDSVGNQTFSYSSATGVVRTTGRFQTGVTTGNNLVLDANLYAGRPAVQFNTGNSSALQPVMYAMGEGSADYRAGSLLIHGRETQINNTGRQTLQIYAGNGSGASLSQEYGSYGGVGFSYENWDLILRGRVRTGSTDLSYLFASRTTASQAYREPFTASWTNTYNTAAPNGGRMVQASAYSRNNLIDVSANVVNNYLGSSVIRARKPVQTTNSYSIRVQYIVLWTQASWNNP